MSINVTRSSMPDYEEFCAEIRDLWDSHWLTNMGEKHNKLEEALKEYLKVPYITLFVNGHMALEDLIASFGLPEGSEVITTAFTFASTTHAIVRNGLKPVFCDIDPADCTMDGSKIEELITENTSAILPVHVYGNPCHVEEIEDIAKKHGLKVIYDAAHTFGVEYKGKSLSAFGDASMISFHATKVFNTIEGGAAIYKDGERACILDDLKNFGIRDPETCCYVGGNAKMNEFQAAMGLCNLKYIDAEIEKRKIAAERYLERLEGVKGIRCVLSNSSDITKRNYAYMPVVFEGYKYLRDEVWQKLKDQDIVARKYFYPLTRDFSCYSGLKTYELPVSERMAENVLTLPLYAGLSLEDTDRICDIILK
jgi:dTDP-4-amino-4,6-dideoxygalactose transaminase